MSLNLIDYSIIKYSLSAPGYNSDFLTMMMTVTVMMTTTMMLTAMMMLTVMMMKKEETMMMTVMVMLKMMMMTVTMMIGGHGWQCLTHNGPQLAQVSSTVRSRCYARPLVYTPLQSIMERDGIH